MRRVVIVAALALAVSTLSALAQDAGGGPPAKAKGGAGGGATKGGPGQGGFHLLPPRAVEQLNLTDDQKKQIADLEAEVKAKLAQILTPEQMEQLKQMRPPRPPAGKGEGGPGGGGPGGGGAGGGVDQPTRQRPPSE